MTASSDIAAELKRIRKLHGWSQEDLARELGVSFATVNRWENGHHQPTISDKRKIRALCRKHGIDI